eukprot:PhF_6_TR20486/c0_g2_i1/m.29498
MLTSFGIFTNVLKSIIGAGVLALPYCILRAGVIPTFILLIVVWIVSAWTTVILCISAETLDNTMKALVAKTTPLVTLRDSFIKSTSQHEDGEDDIVTYHQLSIATFGTRYGAKIAWLGIVPAQWIVGVSFLIYINENTAHALGYSEGVVALVMTAVATLMSTPRTMDYLSYTSTFGNTAFLCGIISIVLYAVFIQGLSFNHVEMYGSVGGVFEA